MYKILGQSDLAKVSIMTHQIQTSQINLESISSESCILEKQSVCCLCKRSFIIR